MSDKEELDSQDAGEREREQFVRRRSTTWLFGGLVLFLLSVLVLLQVFGLWEIFTPDTASDTLLIYALSTLNFVAFLIFAFIFIRNLLKLRRERRERQLGSKIKTRLVVYFIAVSLLPVTAMALFSYMFFNRTVEKYFSPFPQDVSREAKRAQEEAAQRHSENLRRAASLIAAQAETVAPDEATLDALLQRADLSALVLISANEGGANRAIMARAFSDRLSSDAYETDAQILSFAREPGEYVWQRSEGLYDVSVAQLSGGRALVAARARERSSSLSQLVAGAQTFEDFRRNQRKVRLLGLSTIGLMTLLLLFAATWSAIHLARGIGGPIRALAEASNRIAGGDLSHRVTAIADDELAILAAAFNEMTAQLAENRARLEQKASELRETNAALEERRGYIETVLESLSTGVVSLDEINRVTTINAAALQMFRMDSPPEAGTPLAGIVSVDDYAILSRLLWRARLRGRAAEHMELAPETQNETNAQPIPVALTATALAPRPGEERRGVVLVMEDLTELIAAQRAAAWSEVARRMAHEIKNPLTPIQLSAERIALNFRRAFGYEAKGEENGATTKRSDAADYQAENSVSHSARSVSSEAPADANGNGHERERVARIVEECTATITREVAGLKAMVDEFARFARFPHARLEQGDLNEVIKQAVALYEDRLDGVRLDALLAPRLPASLLDAEQLRRVFVNLFDNALEALADVEDERRITIATAHDPARGLILAEIADTGHGIRREDFPRLFQPYFSTRRRGTGLGLAIVQRIIADHGGRIRAESNRPRGARMIVELPVAEDAREQNRNDAES